jgi:hypothetical protein
MRIARALVVAVIFMVVAHPAISSALAWYWPILGFHYSCQGYPPKDAPLPGTPGWPFYPDSGRAELVPPGVAYCPISGNLDFGPVPPLPGRPNRFPVTNETSGKKGLETNSTLNSNLFSP